MNGERKIRITTLVRNNEKKEKQKNRLQLIHNSHWECQTENTFTNSGFGLDAMVKMVADKFLFIRNGSLAYGSVI